MLLSILKTIWLGVVQGLTEFLPVSSSGHLVLFKRLMGMPETTDPLLEILLHVGTLVAVMIVFWADWWAMLRHLFTNRVVRLLIVATVPAVVATLLLNDFISAAFGGQFLGYSFLITSVLLFASDWLARRAQARTGRHAAAPALEDMRYGQALAMGGMQAFALIPGVSRSGSTIVGGLAAGVTRENAAKFSFMMSAVAIVGSLMYEAKDFIEAIRDGGAAFEGGWLAALLGMAAAAVSGYIGIRWMLRLIQRVSLKWFGLYTAILGVAVLAFQFFGK